MSHSAAAEQLVSVEEYLRLEEASPVKHEYVAGRIYALAGPTKRHNVIVGNIYRALWEAAEGGPCRLYFAEVKLRAAADVVYYPDVMVACEPEGADAYMEDAPCLVIEVVSPTTATIDRREKLFLYRRLPSLSTYLVVEQEERRIEHHWRDENGAWCLEVATSGSIPLSCPSGELPLDRVYQGVAFDG
ncbi:MAG TPA: Uma2 family endonuclease [Longimicrobiaceae bacterium]|nr:Uma2 family endonuclease [Longimicrobiaceae bacterium]